MDQHTQDTVLRHLAEDRLVSCPPTSTMFSQSDATRLIHELQVHQIELELQNKELQLSRAELEAAQDKYADLYNHAPVGYLILGKDGTIQQTNLMGAQIMGVHQGNLIGRRMAMFVAGTDLGTLYTFVDRVFAAHAQQACELVLATEQRQQDCRFIRLEGIISSDGQECKLVISDITARRDNEERLRILYALAPEPIVVFDTAWALRDVNLAYETMTGYSNAELVGMKPIEQGVVMPVSSADMQHVIAALAQGRQVDQFEARVQSKSGARIEVEVTIHPAMIGGIPVYMASLHDITARKQTETALRESLQKLAELNELKSRFVSVAAHQFRTPLATIAITTDNLSAYRKRMDDAKINYRLQKIQTEVRNMKILIDDLLDLTCLQSVGYTIKPERLDLDAACRAIVEQFQEDPALAHTLAYTCDEQPVNVWLDARLMGKTLTNLITNALKYSPAGTTIAITLAPTADRITLRVSDHGIGIPAADLPNLFQPFQRGSNVNERPGTGLGLSIARNAVELHGGTITVESEVGQGTTFTVILPRPDETSLPRTSP